MAVRNNGGGHANHTLFWEIMGPNGGGDPSGALGDAIADAFGGVADLKAAVNDAGVKRFGSGWTWLVWDGTGLAVKSTPNQDTPVMDGEAPLLGIDVWEHAYYLNYQNRRPDYLEAWWNVVDWDAVAAPLRRGARARTAAIRPGRERVAIRTWLRRSRSGSVHACADPGIMRPRGAPAADRRPADRPRRRRRSRRVRRAARSLRARGSRARAETPRRPRPG